jgi:hypothetical protein
MAHFTAQSAIGFPLNIYVKEGKAAISFHLTSELHVLLGTVQVAVEVPQPVRSVGSDDKSIFNLVECSLLEVLHIKLAMTAGSGEPIAMLSFVCRSMRLSGHARRASGHPEMSTSQTHGLPNRHSGEE